MLSMAIQEPHDGLELRRTSRWSRNAFNLTPAALRQPHIRVQLINAAVQVGGMSVFVPSPYPGSPRRLNTQKVESLHGDPGYWRRHKDAASNSEVNKDKATEDGANADRFSK